MYNHATLLTILALSILAAAPLHAFGVVSTTRPTVVASSKSTQLLATATEDAASEAERMLRKARELREQAAHAEQQVHAQLHEKKAQHEEHLDGLLDVILGSGSSSTNNKKSVVAQKLQDKHVSMETLEHMMDRLDDRLALAEGGAHIDAATLETVQHKRDEALATQLERQMDTLLEAVQILDDDFRKAHSHKAVGGVAGQDSDGSGSLLYSVSSVEQSHWGGGHAYTTLKQRLQEKQRARTEEFQKRQEEFYEAQRVKKDNDVPKVKDDHGFLP